MSGPTPARRTPSKADRAKFLEALENGWTVRDASKLTGRHYTTLYALRKADEAFAAEWDEAVEAGTQALEQEAYRRAVDGYDEVTYNAYGEVVRKVHRYSDALLQKLLAGRRPEVYGNQVAVVGDPDRPISFVFDSLLSRAQETYELPPGDILEEDG